MKKILVIDDEKEMREVLFDGLSKEGYSVITADEANDGFEKIKLSRPDLILLDIMLPDIVGLQFCKFLKDDKEFSEIPVIMLTSVDKMNIKISGFSAGADDYVTKPFDFQELNARIRVALRRHEKNGAGKFIIKSGTLSLDPETRIVMIGKDTLTLAPKEYELLYLLMKNKEKVFSRNDILETIWGFEYHGTTRTVDVHIRYIRRKLKGHAEKITAVEGIGYKFSG